MNELRVERKVGTEGTMRVTMKGGELLTDVKLV